MPTKKKRASFSKSAHIAVAAQTASLEDDVQPVSPEDTHPEPPTEVTASVANDVIPVEKPVETEDSGQALEEMLASDADEPVLTKKNIALYRLGIIGTGCIVFVSILMYLLFLKQSSRTSPVSTVPVAATPVPTIAVDPKSITLEVLNGSGVSGKASKTASQLKEKGYTIVSTGNAKKIAVSSLSVSATLPDRAKELLLSDLQTIGISSISSVLTDSSVSARITLGLQ